MSNLFPSSKSFPNERSLQCPKNSIFLKNGGISMRTFSLDPSTKSLPNERSLQCPRNSIFKKKLGASTWAPFSLDLSTKSFLNERSKKQHIFKKMEHLYERSFPLILPLFQQCILTQFSCIFVKIQQYVILLTILNTNPNPVLYIYILFQLENSFQYISV